MDYQDEIATFGKCQHLPAHLDIDEQETKEKIISKLLKIMKKYDKENSGMIKNSDIKPIIQQLRARMSEAEMY